MADHPRALFRRATAHAALLNYEAAREDFELCKALSPALGKEVDRCVTFNACLHTAASLLGLAACWDAVDMHLPSDTGYRAVCCASRELRDMERQRKEAEAKQKRSLMGFLK